MERKQKIGLWLIIGAFAILAGWSLWFNSRIWCPVQTALSLKEGEETRTNDFRVNLTGNYEIEIEGQPSDAFNEQELICALGVQGMSRGKQCAAPVLHMTWELANDNQIVARGSSDNDYGGGGTSSDSAFRTVGIFKGSSGQAYRLTVKMASDASSLAPAHPQLKVSLFDTQYEFSLVVAGLLRLFAGILAVAGLILLIPWRSFKSTAATN